MKFIITRLYYGSKKKCVFRFISRNNNVYDSIRSLIGTWRNTEKTELFTPSYYMSNTLMIFLYVHVNCFVILSGYFGCNKDFSFSKWAKLWAQVFFWSVALYFFSYIITGEFQLK